MQIFIDGRDVTKLITQCSISRQANAHCWEIGLSIAEIVSKPDYLGQQRITVIDDDDMEYGFLLEEWSQQYDSRSEGYEIWGRSLQALGGQGYAKTVTDTEATESIHPWQNKATTAQAVINYLLASDYCPYPLTVTWNITNYPIKKGALSVSGQYPLDIILMLASEVGAYVFPMPDGSLIIEEYQIIGETAGVSYADEDDIFDIPGSIKLCDSFNSVTVVGYDESAEEESSASVTAKLSVQRIGSGTLCEGTPHTVRVYKYHPSNASIVVAGTDDAAAVPGASGTESFTEKLLLKNGLGSHSLFDSNGKNEVDIPALHSTKLDFYTVNYSTPYTDYTVDGLSGDNALLFYFADGSAEAEYSFSYEICPPEPECGAEHPELCASESACTGAGLYWWDNACHTDSEPTRDVTFIVTTAKGVLLHDAPVYIDNAYIGTTDSEGKTPVINLGYGVHTVYIPEITVDTKMYAATNADMLDNDAFSIGE